MCFAHIIILTPSNTLLIFPDKKQFVMQKYRDWVALPSQMFNVVFIIARSETAHAVLAGSMP